VICERCGTVFCWDEADEGTLGGGRRRYCGKSCRIKAQPSSKQVRLRRNRRSWQVADCTSRRKERYADIDAAMVATARIFRQTGKDMYPYECACGSWHLSKQQMANDHLLRVSP
jgi:hypothetical protein